MPREWSLTVEDFGRIERAEVTVKPLTVLVGPNNSGKSYLGMLVWGIESGGLNDLRLGFPPLDALIGSWSSRASQSESYWEPWSAEECHAFFAHWPDYVRAVVPRFCRLLLDVKDLLPRSMEVSAHGLEGTWYAAVEKPPSAEKRRARWFRFANDGSLPPIAEDARPTLAERHHGGWREWGTTGHDQEGPRAGAILAFMAGFTRRFMSFDYLEGSAVFLPASRTGFALFLPTFLQLRLGSALTEWRAESSGSLDGGNPGSGTARFTLPHIHLMSGLTSAFGGKRGPFADEADRLERECLDGTIVVRADTGVANYSFRPRGASDDLGLQLSSALVTELMPLVVLLRYAQELPFLVIEEPEAHLHPKLQRAVTRCLCRLVRRGVRVLITTHSATIAQQINNLVKLGGIEGDRREELQRRFYEGADEYLEGDDVAMHEFRFGDDGRTVVERVEQSAWGFPLPTFNDDLHRLTDETLALNAELEPEADR